MTPNLLVRGIYTLLFLSFATLSFANLSEDKTVYDYTIKVVDQNGEPLIGVGVYTDDRSFQDFTDVDGKIVLKDIPDLAVLNFEYIGYEKLIIPFYEIKKRSGIIRLELNNIFIEEIVVIGRRDQTIEEVPYTVQNVSKKDIAFLNPQNSADALQDIGGVYVQKSQMGGGSPVIRGFEANRVLLVVDGVRMNNAIYRNGHLQNAITVDASILERMEVIYGPGSLIYGSDALGGVVHFRSRDPKLYFGTGGPGYTMETNVFSRFSTANLEKTIHGDISYGTRNWGSITSFTVADYGDLKTGSKRPEGWEDFGKRFFYQERAGVDQIFENPNPDIQVGTGYGQIDFLQKIKRQYNDDFYVVGNFQFSTSTDIPRYDNLTDTTQTARQLKWAEWYYGPQQRIKGSIKAQIRNKPMYDKLTLIAGVQRIDEDRNKRKFKKSLRTFNFEDVWVYSFTADVEKGLGKSDVKQHHLAYGIDLNHNDVKSVAGDLVFSNETIIPEAVSRYPVNGSKMNMAGSYLNYSWKSADSLFNFNGGLRYSFVQVHSMFSEDDPIEWPASYYTEGIGQSLHDLTWGAGFTYSSRKKLQIRALVSRAFRAPNIDDFSKIREKGGFVTIPNPNLKPEKAISAELTIGKDWGDLNGDDGVALKLSGTGFYTILQDAMVRRNMNLVLGDGTELTHLIMDGDSLRTQANVNAASGFVMGYSGNMRLRIGENWKINGGINYTKGRTRFQKTIAVNEDGDEADVNEIVVREVDIDTLVPMAHIPPMYGTAGLRYEWKKWSVEANMRFNGAKPLEEYGVNDIQYNNNQIELDQLGSSDNLDRGGTAWRVQEDGSLILEYTGTYAWMTYNFYSSYQVNDTWEIDFAVENILDTHYRQFSSGISAPGRNFIIALRGHF